MSAQYYRVTVGGFGLTLDDLHHPVGQQEIRIIPVIGGAGGDVGQIILGVALFAVSFLATAGGGAIFGAAFAKNLGLLAAGQMIGATLVLGGIASLLSPTPQLSLGDDGANDPRKSYSFSGVQNTSRQGVPVPIVYGEILVGSVVISAGIDTVQVKA